MESIRRWARPCMAGLALLACAATLWPFAHMIAWGGIVAIACEPVVESLAIRLRSRSVAAMVVSIALALAVALPLIVAVGSAAAEMGLAFEWGKKWLSHGLPSAPEWLSNIPLAGQAAAEFWNATARDGLTPIVEWGKAHAGEAASVGAGFAGVAAASAMGALAALGVAALMMAKGRHMAQGLSQIALQVIGEKGPWWLALVASAFRGVAVGVCGTALALSVLVALGLALAGIPAVSLLFCLAMVLCLAQIGPLPILAPAAAYLASQGSYGAACGIVALALALSILDGVMRPYLIGRHVRMSMLLIFSGVVGGLMAFGLIGLFVGPAALAVGTKIWSQASEADKVQA
jgi:predicted PurR-regulated permease PerM